MFWTGKYDRAMTLFLGAVKELADLAMDCSQANLVPYSIEGDKIGGSSIHYSFNRDERWTVALKYMLADLKFLLAWVSKDTEDPDPLQPSS